MAKSKTQSKTQQMDKLIEQYGLDIKQYDKGDLVEGTVVSLSPQKILIDVGAKAEGVVTRDEMSDSENSYKNLKVGDEVLVMVIRPENRQGFIELSIKRAEEERVWRDLNRMYDEKTPFEVEAKEYNKGGLICDALGMQGFVPISHLDSSRFSQVSSNMAEGGDKDISERMQPLIGETLKVQIIELDRSQNRLVLSEKAAYKEKQKEKRKERLNEIEVGDKVKGIVSGVVPYGLFVDLDGLEGLVHVSEIAWEKVDKPINYHSVGDEIEALILDIDKKEGKVGLSIKRLKDNPWEKVAEKYPEGTKVEGEVTKTVQFGAFVEIEPGLEGLVHISEMAEELEEGEEVKAVVTLVDPDEQRLGLSTRQLEEDLTIYK